jgi:type I restriction enzyme M protein
MIYHLADNGTMAIVLPHGALFRGGAEQHIRRYLIENKNFLDAVIGLPANIFYGTSIPTCILVFKKCRENPNDILFIDASNDFEKIKTQNVLRKADIDKIITHYRNRTGLEKYSKIIPIRKDAQFLRVTSIEENDYNLNIPRYVDTFEAEESIDIEAIANELKALDKEIKNADSSIAVFCKELNISTPF